MSDWRHNSSGYWSNQGSGHEPQYPSTIDEEQLEDEQAYAQTGEGYTYASPQDYQVQGDQQQAYWSEEPQAYYPDDQAVYTSNDQQYYQPPDDQGEVTYTPTTYTSSMDVNFSLPPSERGQSPTQQAAQSSPPPLGEGDPEAEDDRTQDFVAQRQDSYDRREEFRTAPDTASIRRVVDTRRRIRESEAARARAARERERAARGSGSGGGGGSGGSTGRSGGSGSRSGSRSGGNSKGSGSKSGGRS